MRRLYRTIILVLLILVSGCDPQQGALEDALPVFYTLSTQAAPQEGGTIEPSDGEFLEGVGVQIIARPAEGYVFDHWEGDLEGESNPDYIQFNSNRTVQAHFSLRDYDLNIEVIGSGVVNETVTDRSSTVTVRLDAEAEEGWYFDHWEGDLSGSSNPETLVIEENKEKSVRAIFFEEAAPEYSLNITIEGGGTVQRDPDQSSYTEGEVVTLTATGNSEWHFKEWGGDLSGSRNPVKITMDEDKRVTTIFDRDEEPEEPDEYTLTVNTSGEGSVDKDPDKSTYTDGEDVTLQAKPDDGWSFKEWQGDESGSENPVTVVADRDKQITAVFEEDAVLGITIGEVKLFINEMELEGARRTDDFKTKDFILNMPTDGSPFHITHEQIPPGFYEELEFEIEKPGKSEDLDDSDFTDGSDRFSLVVSGLYNGSDFTFQSDEDFEIEIEMSPHLEVKEGQTSVIGIPVDFESWFRGDDGEILDPSDSRNAKQINKNIEDSFDDFED